jgi:Holliday junction resolvasome RuvABC ATP-dependent DNA helicase subunit
MSFLCWINKHDFKKKYINEDRCEMQEVCTRCGVKRNKVFVEHDIEWLNISPCISKRVCKRCGKFFETKEDHDWRFKCGKDLYDIEKKCAICNLSETYTSKLLDFVGQKNIIENLITLTLSAKNRHEQMPHILLSGQKGMGKKTLSILVANEMDSNYTLFSNRDEFLLGDYLEAISHNEGGHFIIIDDVESIFQKAKLRRYLLESIHDLSITFTFDKGINSRSHKFRLKPFTLIGITSNPNKINSRCRELFFMMEFNGYNTNEINEIILKIAGQSKIEIDSLSSKFLAALSSENPGKAKILLNKVYKYSERYHNGFIDTKIAIESMKHFSPNYKEIF